MRGAWDQTREYEDLDLVGLVGGAAVWAVELAAEVFGLEFHGLLAVVAGNHDAAEF